MSLEIRVPIHGYVVVYLDSDETLSEDEAIAIAQSIDAYPDLGGGVLEYAWEDASVREVQPPSLH